MAASRHLPSAISYLLSAIRHTCRLAILAERCYNYSERRDRRQTLNKESSKAQTKLLFDTSSLITAAQFGVGGQFLIETEEIGEQLLKAIRSRYRTGFIEHSLLMLKGML